MKKICLFHLLIFFLLSAGPSPLFSKQWKRIYLATPQRSGNHWLRYLIEEASHIATGAVYCDKDPPHLEKAFPWGGYACDHGYEGNCRYPDKEDIVLIKTHFPESRETPFDKQPYCLTIRVVRHPVDSFYSRYVKNPGGPLKSKVPAEKVKRYIEEWRRFQLYWDKMDNVITFKYEEMLEDPFPFLKKICQLLHYDVRDEDITRAINKFPPEGEMLKHLDKFRKSDLEKIQKELGGLMAPYGYTASS